jgi:hypothetical protein
MRDAIAGLNRFIVTPRVAKFRMFAWLKQPSAPDHQLIVFAREDDYFFGVLHSGMNERWSRRMGTQLREAESGCRYTPTTCFETFPFPPYSGGISKDVPKQGDFAGAPDDYDAKKARKLRDAVAAAAKKLVELRDQWLNPTTEDGSPMLDETQLKKRTLTNLYNQRPTWLENAHLDLDRAVLAAYGWPAEWAGALQPRRDDAGKITPTLGVVDAGVEQEVFRRLLDLNQRLSGVDASQASRADG